MDAKALSTWDHQKVHSPANQNLLIIGGTSSLSNYICNLAISEGWKVYCTYRDEGKRFLNKDLSWLNLDFSQYKSVNEALIFLEALQFDRIIYLAGELSNFQNDAVEFPNFSEYFTRNISMPVWFLKSLLLQKEFKVNSTFTYLSSRASEFGSNDYCYGAGKAALENLVKSFSLLNQLNLEFKIIVSGLIEGSRMYERMLPHIVEAHKNKSKGQLLSAKEAASQIWEISSVRNLTSDLEKFKIGPEY